MAASGKSLDEANYEVRHGLSYSKFKCEYSGITATKTLFVPKGEDAEVWDVVLKNNTDKPRTISTFSFVEFSFSHIQSDNQNHQMSLYSAGTSYQEGVLEYDLYYNTNDFEGFYYLASTFSPDSYDGQRDNFLGTYRDKQTQSRLKMASVLTALKPVTTTVVLCISNLQFNRVKRFALRTY